MNVPFRPDRLLDRRTSGEIIASMERQIASPAYAAERDAFYAERAEEHRGFIAAKDTREALETLALELLPAASDVSPLASLNHAPVIEAGRGVTGGVR